MTGAQALDAGVKLLIDKLRDEHADVFQAVMRAIPVQAAEAIYSAAVRDAMLAKDARGEWPMTWAEQGEARRALWAQNEG